MLEYVIPRVNVDIVLYLITEASITYLNLNPPLNIPSLQPPLNITSLQDPLYIPIQHYHYMIITSNCLEIISLCWTTSFLEIVLIELFVSELKNLTQ